MNEPVKALIDKLEDWLSTGLDILRDFKQVLESTPKPVIEQPEADFLARGSQVYARVLKSRNQLLIIPIESFGVKADDKAVKWLEREPFRHAAEKHGLKVSFEEKNGLLEKIKVEGALTPEIVDDLLKPALWALEKASERPSATGQA